MAAVVMDGKSLAHAVDQVLTADCEQLAVQGIVKLQKLLDQVVFQIKLLQRKIFLQPHEIRFLGHVAGQLHHRLFQGHAQETHFLHNIRVNQRYAHPALGENLYDIRFLLELDNGLADRSAADADHL